MAQTLNPNSTAVVGLGLIGAAWADHLESDGVLSATWNRTVKGEAPRFIAELSEVPERASILHLAVSDEVVTEEVVRKLLPKLSSRHAVIQSATIDPATSSTLKALVEGTGAAYIEAPFTGSLPAAKERKTIFFLGGEPAAIDAVVPYIKRLSQAQFKIGSNVQACTIKLSMNLQIVSAMTALAEAITICRSAGIPDDLFYSVFKLNASYSGMAALKEQKLLTGDFSPQFSVKHMAKDLRLLEKTTEGVEYQLLATVSERLREAERAGLGEEDFSAIVKLLKG